MRESKNFSRKKFMKFIFQRLARFPLVEESPLLMFSNVFKDQSHCRLAGWTGEFCKSPVLRVLHRVEVFCQAKQGAVVDVVWNQHACFGWWFRVWVGQHSWSDEGA
jgi:hypothetical protein